MSQSRHLAAIMFTDIVGYTTLMGNDEDKAFELLKKNRELQKPIIEEFNGKWIKELGDGIMASFDTVSDAVSAAIRVQEKCSEARNYRLRIGIHLGEVIFENDDVFGDGVNIAARIQAIATPGSIFISEPVYNNIYNKKDFHAIFIKAEKLKNVKDRVRIYKVITSISEEASLSPEPFQKATPKQSIAVLPFVNMSNDPEQEYFSDGMAEEILNSLSHLKELKVAGRTSSFQFKGKNIDLRQVGHKLGVSKVLEGSVRKQGNQIRITVQLINVEDGFHLWGEKYDRNLNDIFAIQDEIALAVTEKLKVTLLEYDRELITKSHTQNTEAYQLYLQGRYFWNKRNKEGLETSIHYFQAAIESDSNYALAWTGIADAHNLLREYGTIPLSDGYSKAKAAAKKALQIDPNLAEAHISLAELLMIDEWDWLNAAAEFRLGLQLNPNYATGHHWYAEWLMYMGNFEEALSSVSRAIELDPVSQAILLDKALILYYSRQYYEAIQQAILASQLNPNFAPVHRILSLSYQGNKNYDLAIAENRRLGEILANPFKTDIFSAQILAAFGHFEDAKKVLNNLDPSRISAGHDYRGLALVYIGLGNKDTAFTLLEKSYECHEHSLCSLKVDPKLDPLRDDSRFEELTRRLKFPVMK